MNAKSIITLDLKEYNPVRLHKAMVKSIKEQQKPKGRILSCQSNRSQNVSTVDPVTHQNSVQQMERCVEDVGSYITLK